ncbi:MAG: 50S ribosomal protein L13 [Clostridia bacterium]|nr:50S ribosomal protein L13 [Clostridia bacterium]
MKTFMATPESVERKWYVVDATDIPLGRLASQVAAILRGKNKPTFTPNVDTGDYVIVINSDKVVLTGKKLENKMYRRHTGWIGNMKEMNYATLMKDRSDFAVQLAVKGMLPKTNLGRGMLKRLRVYKNDDYEAQKAQKPEVLVLKEGVRR